MRKESIVRIGFLGPEGTFSEEAARQIWEYICFSETAICELVSFATPHALKMGLFHGLIDWAVIPFENSITGPVEVFQKEFVPLSDFEVNRGFTLPVHHCLFKLPGMKTEALRFVFSHPQALLQTADTRAANPAFAKLEACVTESTARAAKLLADGVLPVSAAVICSKSCGHANGLELVAENLEDDPRNTTTFRLLAL